MLPHSIRPRRLIAEIGLLIDYISGRGNRTFLPNAAPGSDDGSYQKLGPDPIGGFLSVCQLFDAKGEASDELVGKDPQEVEAWERLVLTRDWLNSLASPVTGDTIAFSILVSQMRADQPANSDDAREAFPMYVDVARKMAFQYQMLRAFAICLTLAIFVASTWSLFGYMALSSLADLRTRTELMEHEQEAKEATINAAQGSGLGRVQLSATVMASAGKYLRYCEDPEFKQFMEGKSAKYTIIDAEQLDFCRRRSDLTARRDAAYQTLNYWILGGLPRLGWFVERNKETHTLETTVTISDDAARAWLMVVAGCILPLLMAMLGSTVAVLRDYVSNIRERLLAPRDRRLYQIRWTLGIVVGVAVGFFFVPSAPGLQAVAIAGPSVSSAIASAAALSTTSNLSAPALGFVAGYAVDLFFQFLSGTAQAMFLRKETS